MNILWASGVRKSVQIIIWFGVQDFSADVTPLEVSLSCPFFQDLRKRDIWEARISQVGPLCQDTGYYAKQ